MDISTTDLDVILKKRAYPCVHVLLSERETVESANLLELVAYIFGRKEAIRRNFTFLRNEQRFLSTFRDSRRCIA